MGYSHSYLDPETAELKSLAIFPTNEEIEVAAGEAWEEAIALLDLLGIRNTDITHPQPTTSTGSSDPTHSTLDSDEPFGNEESNPEENETEILEYLVDVQRSPGWGDVDEETRNKLHTLLCAATALEIEDQEKL